MEGVQIKWCTHSTGVEKTLSWFTTSNYAFQTQHSEN
jgi:hypothetical protein